MVELTAAVALENFRSKFNVPLGVEAQGFWDQAECSGCSGRPAPPGASRSERVPFRLAPRGAGPGARQAGSHLLTTGRCRAGARRIAPPPPPAGPSCRAASRRPEALPPGPPATPGRRRRQQRLDVSLSKRLEGSRGLFDERLVACPPDKHGRVLVEVDERPPSVPDQPVQQRAVPPVEQEDRLEAPPVGLVLPPRRLREPRHIVRDELIVIQLAPGIDVDPAVHGPVPGEIIRLARPWFRSSPVLDRSCDTPHPINLT